MKNRQLILIFFLIAQLYIFGMIMCFNDIISTTVLSIVSTGLCVTLGIFMFCKRKDYYITMSALSLTLLADIFLLLVNTTIGLFLLNIVQILYFLRTFLDSDSKKEDLIVRSISIPIIIALCFVFLKEKTDINAILWCIYITNIFINLLFTIKEIGINNFFPIGLIFLFIHASLMMFIGLEDYIILNIPFINYLVELPFDVKTLFYLPAQVILTCSIFTVNRSAFSKIKDE